MTELQLEQTIRQRKLFRPGQRILVAVSGGVDSMVLLAGLNNLAPRYRWHLTVAHLNHKLRGRSSDADQRLVQQTATAMGLPFDTEVADVRASARERKISIEMAARALRHEFLARAAARRRIRTLAMAHHADDQLELFFLRLFRGSSGDGLAGMQWRNPSPVDARLEIVRPLLDVPKSALAEHATEHKIQFREDATNRSLDIQRNRIRQELIPLLNSEYQPALSKTVLRTMEIVGAEAEFVLKVARLWLEARWDKRSAQKNFPQADFGALPFERLPEAVQRRVVQQQLLRLRLPAEFALVEQLRLKPERPVSVTPMQPERAGVIVPISVTRDQNGIVKVQKGDGERFTSSVLEVDLDYKNELIFDGVRIGWQIKDGGRASKERKVDAEWFDADEVGMRVTLRHWQPGDRFQPIGMAQPVKLQDLFTNAKIPRSKRHQLLVGVTQDGRLFWVEGLRIAERFKLSETTIRRLHWQWQRL